VEEKKMSTMPLYRLPICGRNLEGVKKGKWYQAKSGLGGISKELAIRLFTQLYKKGSNNTCYSFLAHLGGKEYSEEWRGWNTSAVLGGKNPNICGYGFVTPFSLLFLQKVRDHQVVSLDSTTGGVGYDQCWCSYLWRSKSDGIGFGN
jgi:hypothetical protein